MPFATVRHGRRHFRTLIALGKRPSDSRHDESGAMCDLRQTLRHEDGTEISVFRDGETGPTVQRAALL